LAREKLKVKDSEMATEMGKETDREKGLPRHREGLRRRRRRRPQAGLSHYHRRLGSSLLRRYRHHHRRYRR
jgi:hypothetical protein